MAGGWSFKSPMAQRRSRISTRSSNIAARDDEETNMDLADFDRAAVLASFLVESEEGLDLMEQALVQMESSPSDPELVHSVFRVAHTLKGNATSLGLRELAGFAHVVEDLLDVFREQQSLPSADLISLLLKAVDELRAMVSTSKSGSPELTPAQQKIRKEIAR